MAAVADVCLEFCKLYRFCSPGKVNAVMAATTSKTARAVKAVFFMINQI